MRHLLLAISLACAPCASADTLNIVEAGLNALRARQHQDGRWTGTDPGATVGTTAQALLPFLGVGAMLPTTGAEHPSRRTAQRALAFLMAARAPDGRIGTSCIHVVRDQTFAALALLRAAEDAGRDDWKTAGLAALAWLAERQSPEGHWRHLEPEGTAVTVDWSLVTLLAFRAGARATPDRADVVAAARRAADWLAARPLPESAGAEAGATLAARRLAGREAAPEFAMALARQREQVAALDTQGLLHTTLASYHGREDWKAWNRLLRDALIRSDRRVEGEGMTWPAEPGLGEDGHEISVTALRLVCLQIYYRYARALVNP